MYSIFVDVVGLSVHIQPIWHNVAPMTFIFQDSHHRIQLLSSLFNVTWEVFIYVVLFMFSLTPACLRFSLSLYDWNVATMGRVFASGPPIRCNFENCISSMLKSFVFKCGSFWTLSLMNSLSVCSHFSTLVVLSEFSARFSSTPMKRRLFWRDRHQWPGCGIFGLC